MEDKNYNQQKTNKMEEKIKELRKVTYNTTLEKVTKNNFKRWTIKVKRTLKIIDMDHLLTSKCKSIEEKYSLIIAQWMTDSVPDMIESLHEQEKHYANQVYKAITDKYETDIQIANLEKFHSLRKLQTPTDTQLVSGLTKLKENAVGLSQKQVSVLEMQAVYWVVESAPTLTKYIVKCETLEEIINAIKGNGDKYETDIQIANLQKFHSLRKWRTPTDTQLVSGLTKLKENAVGLSQKQVTALEMQAVDWVVESAPTLTKHVEKCETLEEIINAIKVNGGNYSAKDEYKPSNGRSSGGENSKLLVGKVRISCPICTKTHYGKCHYRCRTCNEDHDYRKCDLAKTKSTNRKESTSAENIERLIRKIINELKVNKPGKSEGDLLQLQS